MNKEIMNLSKMELLRLMRIYNNYVMEFTENSKGTPVSLEEFFDNEYQCILEVGDRVRFDNTIYMEEDLYSWLLENRAINWTVVEVDLKSETFYIESVTKINGAIVKERCPYAISLNDYWRRIESTDDICKLQMIDEQENESQEYFVYVDDNFNKNIKALEELSHNYESYQDIEDFIYSNFMIVNIERENIEF